MIVELSGLPGSGKSTFARELVKTGKYTLVTPRGLSEILWLNFLRAITHPIHYVKLLSLTLTHLGPRALWYQKFVNLFLVANAKYQKARCYKNAIIDQGYLQNYFSLFEHPLSFEDYQRVFPLFRGADVVIFFDIPESVRHSRLAKRGYRVREDMPAAYRAGFEKVMQSGAAFLRALQSRALSGEHFNGSPIFLLITSDEDVKKISEALHKEHTDLTALSPSRMCPQDPIIFVINARMPTERAHGVQIVRTAEALIHAGVPVTLWVPARHNQIRQSIEEFYDISIPIPLKKSWCIDLFGRISPVLAHRIVAYTFMLSVFFGRIERRARYITRNPEIAWVLRLRGAKVWYEAHTAPKRFCRLFRFFLRGVCGIIANSDGTQDALRHIGFRKVITIRNGVDLKRFAHNESKEELRKELGLPTHSLIAMYVGGFYAWKGVGTLLDAWKDPALHKYVLVLVGGSDAEIARLGKADLLFDHNERIIVRSHQPAAIIPKFLRAADVLVLPNAPISDESILHTSPIKMFEYMASERPIIASDLPSIREILDEESAIFFRAGDSKSLADALIRVLNPKYDPSGIVAQARRRVEEYSWEKRAKRIIDILKMQ